MDQKHVQISFDEFNRIRLLDPNQLKETEELASECSRFNSSKYRLAHFCIFLFDF